MLMPETAVNKNYRLVLPEHDIRGTGQIPEMQAIANACRPEGAAYDHLRTGVFAPDSLHIFGADCRSMDIRHVMASFANCSAVYRLVGGILGAISFATAEKTGTTTELPNC